MSGLAELSQRHARLKEISGIMTAMKSLSLVEARKLARFIGDQRRMRDNIAAAAADFLRFHSRAVVKTAHGDRVLVAIGSERGFCGNFNERVIHALRQLGPAKGAAALIVVGHRLSARLADYPNVRARIDGPTVTEDIPDVVDRLLDALHETRPSSSGPLDLLCLAHDEHGEPVVSSLLPQPGEAAEDSLDPPELLLAPDIFHRELFELFLLAELYGRLYASLVAESHQRLAHMERALDRLDDALARLALKRNAWRQERIVEEIEVMLSNRAGENADRQH